MSAVTPPIVRHFRKFNPRSRTLIGPGIAVGTCMGSFMPEGSLGWFDSAIRPELGDICAIEVPRPGGAPVIYIKVIEKIGGTLWGLSEDAPLPIVKPMRIIGPLVAALTSPALTLCKEQPSRS